MDIWQGGCKNLTHISRQGVEQLSIRDATKLTRISWLRRINNKECTCRRWRKISLTNIANINITEESVSGVSNFVSVSGFRSVILNYEDRSSLIWAKVLCVDTIRQRVNQVIVDCTPYLRPYSNRSTIFRK